MHRYAVFKEDKLYDFLDDEFSRGINWVRNIIGSGVILVNAPDGKKVSLEIIDSKTKITPYMDENGISSTIKVMLTAILQNLCQRQIYSLNNIKLL